jgi:hypothetical protein
MYDWGRARNVCMQEADTFGSPVSIILLFKKSENHVDQFF